MALKTLIGNNWNTAAHWSPTNVPVGGDTAMLGPDSPKLLTGPATTNQDVLLAALLIHAGYRFPVLDSGNPLTIAATLLMIEHVQDFYFACHAGGAANKVVNCIVQTPSLNLGQVIQIGSSATDGGVVERVRCDRGNATMVNCPTGILEAATGSVDNVRGDARLTLNSGNATIPLLRGDGGSIINSAVITAAHLQNTELTHSDGAVAALFAGHGARVFYDADDTCAFARFSDDAFLDLNRNELLKTFSALHLHGQTGINYRPASAMHAVTLFDWRKRSNAVG